MHKAISLVFVCVLIIPIVGCFNSVDTSRLDAVAETHPSLKSFVDSVKQFYTALQNKEWEKTYEFRTNAFKQDVSLPVYMAEANRSGESWSLDGYKVLDVNINMPPQGPPLIRLIMKFQERDLTSYNDVWWIKEEDSWRCIEAGPSRLTIFMNTRGPWYWLNMN